MYRALPMAISKKCWGSITVYEKHVSTTNHWKHLKVRNPASSQHSFPLLLPIQPMRFSNRNTFSLFFPRLLSGHTSSTGSIAVQLNTITTMDPLTSICFVVLKIKCSIKSVVESTNVSLKIAQLKLYFEKNLQAHIEIGKIDKALLTLKRYSGFIWNGREEVKEQRNN